MEGIFVTRSPRNHHFCTAWSHPLGKLVGGLQAKLVINNPSLTGANPVPQIICCGNIVYDSQSVTKTVVILCEIATRNAQETQDLLNAIRDAPAKWLSFAYPIFDLSEFWSTDLKEEIRVDGFNSN
ncbi:hypothetical protein [Oceanospirillum linum]|uniref:Uncharacterized protein n=1 Tax=Oceanospirillum linum TaxID=966 RepID=A0A1T1H998_OCELI|nr:hypothetical protein [Oceanospirillum linum]OOV86300.1 hypothetical protein BTA35_0213865 [Oceanospirillum linum]